MAEATQAPPQAGTFCWNELMTGDVGSAQKFYTQLFGWQTEDMDMGPAGTYTVYKNRNEGAGGMMESKGGAPSMWVPYVAVDDVDASARKAKELGAKICVEPTDIPNIGRFALFTDPTGATLGIYKSTAK